jgi:hypothetical protein
MVLAARATEVALGFDAVQVEKSVDHVRLTFFYQGHVVMTMTQQLSDIDVWDLTGVSGQIKGKLL